MAEETKEFPGAPLGKVGHEPRDRDTDDEVRQVVRKLVEETPEQRDPLGDVATIALAAAAGAAAVGAAAAPVAELLVTYAPWFNPSRVDVVLIGLAVAGVSHGVRFWRKRRK